MTEPVPIRLLPERPAQPQVGDLWPLPNYVAFDRMRPARQPDGSLTSRLSDQYWREFAEQRPPHELCVFVAEGVPITFNIDSKFCDFKHATSLGYHGGWELSGEFPHGLSISPSVHLMGRWHGFIGAHGVPPGHVGPDLDGRSG